MYDMKHTIKLLSIGIITVMLFFSCRKSTDSPYDNNGERVFTNEYLENNFDYSINISKNSIIIQSDFEVTSSEFIVNDVRAETVWHSRQLPGKWFCLIQSGELPENPRLLPGEDINFYLNINEMRYVGNVTIPNDIYINWPVFDPAEDYIFEWEIERHPDTYLIDFSLNVDSVPEGWTHLSWQYFSRLNSHTVSSNHYEHVGENPYSYMTFLIAMNYKLLGRCFVNATSEAFKIYHSDP